ncbi:MAG: ABC transporter permease [Acidobacteriota bacterium]|jgi:lipopolysaccharide transport system permease protein
MIDRNRFLLVELVRRDIEQRYRGSALGLLWSFVEPAWQLLLFTFVFSLVLRVGLPGEATDSFPIFLFAGLIAWSPLRNGAERATTAIVDSAAMIKNHRFPASLFVVAAVLGEVVHGAIAALIFVAVLLVVGGLAVWNLALLLLAMPLQALLAVGIALPASAVQVYARDVRRGIGLAMNTWFYLTPVVYPVALVPDRFRWAINANPMTGLVSLYRTAFLGGEVLWQPILALIVETAAVLLLGWLTFHRLEPGFVDEI